ncbi:MAG: VOC family protein [Thaumarchaeota archaeon]|nr:VOC family protein [Nitrososphaerota archaeon]MCL5318474.1 VOC family protein [Nitrososphaerota archaeon]
MSEHNIFIWNELVTTDQEVCGKFYSQLFGWERKEVDAGPQLGRYTIFQRNGKDVAGMMNPAIEHTQKLGTRWYAYVSVDNIDTYITRAKELGGALIAGPDDIPEVGRVCLIADPKKALILLMQPATAPK